MGGQGVNKFGKTGKGGAGKQDYGKKGSEHGGKIGKGYDGKLGKETGKGYDGKKGKETGKGYDGKEGKETGKGYVGKKGGGKKGTEIGGKNDDYGASDPSRHTVVYSFPSSVSGADWLPKNTDGTDVFWGFWFHGQPDRKIDGSKMNIGQWFFCSWSPLPMPLWWATKPTQWVPMGWVWYDEVRGEFIEGADGKVWGWHGMQLRKNRPLPCATKGKGWSTGETLDDEDAKEVSALYQRKKQPRRRRTTSERA